jgi:S-adenosylhomocysteine hydrolase
MVLDERITDALNRWETIASAEAIPERLVLLDLMRSSHAPADFSGVDLLVIQHHLGTTVPLVRALSEAGIAPDRIWHVDIPYSTNVKVRTALLELSGQDRCPPLFTDPLVDYSAAQLLRVTTTLLDMWRRDDPKPLLVLDDGAYFFRALSTLRAISHPAVENFLNSFVVEQTTRGHRLLTASEHDVLDLGLRVVSIARTNTKESFEGPFIGAAVAQSIARKAQIHRIAKMAVLGFGIVGEACARALIRQFPDAQVTVVEERPAKLRAASSWLGENQVHSTLGDDNGYDLVVGCTGRNSFTLADRHLLSNGAVLASGSSAAVEFDRAGFVDLADYYPDDEIQIVDRDATRRTGVHADITMRLEGRRTATFVNAGFPVNFDGGMECLPVKMIQPTRCLMYAAAEQVLRQTAAGVRELDANRDDWIYGRALEQLPG